MDTVVNVVCVVWSVLVLVVGTVLIIGLALVGALFLLPILVFAAAFT